MAADTFIDPSWQLKMVYVDECMHVVNASEVTHLHANEQLMQRMMHLHIPVAMLISVYCSSTQFLGMYFSWCTVIWTPVSLQEISKGVQEKT